MKLAIFGASGLAREVRDIAVSIGCKEVVFIGKTTAPPVPGLSPETENTVDFLAQKGFVFSIGIGSTNIRKAVWSRHPGLSYVNLIHPSATFGCGQREELLKRTGNIVFAGARFTNQITIGNFGIYYLNCTVAHDCVIEDFVTLCPGANVSGNVELKEGAYLGANSCVVQGRSDTEKMVVGRYATVGAGAVVTQNVPDDIIVKGVPAK